MLNNRRRFRLLTDIFQKTLFVLAVCMSGVVSAQTVTTVLNSPSVLNAPVVPGQLNAEIKIPVSSSDSMRLQVIAPVNGVTLSLLNPDGALIIPPLDPSVSFLDGAQLSPPLPGGVFITPTVNSPVDGDWTVMLEFPAALEKTVIVATLFTETAYQVGIVMERENYRVGQTASIGLIALNSGIPIQSLSPEITVTPPSGLPASFTGLDNGAPGNLDGLADDGIYSGIYTFNETGLYTIFSEVSIPTGAGSNIKRTAVKTVNVTEPLIEIDNVVGHTILRSGGCIEGLNVQVTATALQPSTYVASARLIGSNGLSIESSLSRSQTSAGPMSFDLFFSGDEIREKIMIDGAYQVSSADLLSFETSGVSLEARKFNAFTFPAITLSELCMDPIEISQSLQVNQTLSNGFIESLQFSFPVAVENTGTYQVSLKVTDSAGQDVELFAFSQFMNVGSNTVEVSASYDKFQAADGPYSVESVLILGLGNSAQASVVGSSDNLLRWQFLPYITGDLDADGDVDTADRSVLLSFRNVTSSSPGDRRDLTGDGLIDLRDARLIARLVCVAGSCPIN